MLKIYVHLLNGKILVVEYDCNQEDPFVALRRAYRDEDRFMVWDVEKITFSNTRAEGD